MATSREQRMQERMRGAGRHEVADDSFGFVLPVAEASPDPPSSTAPVRSEPNTSAKRRRLDNDPRLPNQSSARRTSPRLRAPSAPILPQEEKEPEAIDSVTQPSSSRNPQRSDPYELEETDQDASKESLPEPATAADAPETGDSSSPAAAPRPVSRASSTSRRSQDLIAEMIEEVTESPAAAPGSGKRRPVGTGNAGTQSAKLQKIVLEEEEAGATGEATTSSPLVRKARQSETTLGANSTRATRSSVRISLSSPIETRQSSSPTDHRPPASSNLGASDSVRSTRRQVRRSPLGIAVDEINELSSPPDAVSTSSARAPQAEARKTRTKRRRVVPNFPGEISEAEEQPADEALQTEQTEETGDREAAKRTGRKRRRTSPRQREPLDEEMQTAEIEGPSKKSRLKRTQSNPAQQSQPKSTKGGEKQQRLVRTQSEGGATSITVQRYTRPLQRDADNSDEDILNDDIPFTDHKSPNVIDRLLEVFEAWFAKGLAAIHEKANQAENREERRESRTRMRTLEAYQQQIRLRLLTHSVALDHLRTLDKKVRAAQKEKVSLRNEILRIRAEREQVALKMDAVRVRHETANRESLYQLDLSAAMDDIELAVGNGKTAPDLTDAKERKAAELENLDLLVAQISSIVTPAGDGGGALKRIKDFNAVLERAAAALEAR